MQLRTFPILIALGFSVIFFSSCGKKGVMEKQTALIEQFQSLKQSYNEQSRMIPEYVVSVSQLLPEQNESLRALSEATSEASKIKFSKDELNAEKIQAFAEQQKIIETAMGEIAESSFPQNSSPETVQYQLIKEKLEPVKQRISNEKAAFNELVKKYNKSISSFPRSMYAEKWGFEEMPSI